MPMDIKIGDVVELKKQHACGCKEFEITRVGMDIKIKCTKCLRSIMLDRETVEKRIKKIINVAILVLIVIFSSVGCSSDSKYSDLLTKYIEINNDYINQKITKEIMENIVGLPFSSYEEGNENDLNSYIYSVDDEELVISTDNNDKLVFIKYNKLNEIELVNSLIDGTSIGGYKPGFTSKFEIKDLNTQKELLDSYINNR